MHILLKIVLFLLMMNLSAANDSVQEKKSQQELLDTFDFNDLIEEQKDDLQKKLEKRNIPSFGGRLYPNEYLIDEKIIMPNHPFYMSSMNKIPYQYLNSQQNTLPYYQKTTIPNGNQINNYYPMTYPWYTRNAWPYYPYSFSKPSQDNPVLTGRNNFDRDTGVTLDIAKPSRPLSKPPPPVLRPPLSNTPIDNIIPIPDIIYPKEDLYPTFQDSYSLNLSPCVMAIIRCCPSFKNYPRTRDRCLEAFGCKGSIWDIHPCSTNLSKEITAYIQNQQRRPYIL